MTGDEIDTDALTAYLSTELRVEIVGVEVIHDGLNLTIAVSTAEETPAYVLRSPNKFRRTASFNALRREYDILARLETTQLPAPTPVHYCADTSVMGGPFAVLTYLEGEVVPLGEDLPDRFRHPAARSRMGEVLVDALADVHTVDPGRLSDVCDRVPIGAHLDRTITRYDQVTALTGHDPPEYRRVADWLRDNVPPERSLTPCHGDYRPSNVLVDGEHLPTVTGVIDWETAFIGDPLSELGYLLLRWRDDGDPTPSLAGLASRHGDVAALAELREANERGLAPFTSAPGSHSRRELIERYEAETGRVYEHDRFYRGFAAFMLGTVWADLHRVQVEAGDPSDWEPYVEYMGALAESITMGTGKG